MTVTCEIQPAAAVSALRAYDPGMDIVALRQRCAEELQKSLIELGSNENPWGPSPRAIAAFDAQRDALFRYPDPLCGELRHAVSTHLGIDASSLVFGNGSHELLMQLAQAFAGPGDEVMLSQYGFAVFGIAAQSVGAKTNAVKALPEDHASAPLGHDLDAMIEAITPQTKLIYLANPNNPTGTSFGREVLEAFLAKVPSTTLVVIDEAYVELADPDVVQSAMPLLRRYGNLAVARTFSKGYGLAGLRVGYVAAHPQVIAVLETLRENFNINLVAQAAATAAIADQAYLARIAEQTRDERKKLEDSLTSRGWRVIPSQTNFLLAKPPCDASRFEQFLVDQGIVLRPMRGYGLHEYTRISVGRAQDNAALLAAIDSFR